MKTTNYHSQINRPRCQTTIEVNKITKRLISQNPNLSKKHCPEDQACLHCCQCWIKFKDQYDKRIKFFDTKIAQDQQQINLLKSIIERLTKQSLDLKKKFKNTSDFETIKQNLREELRKEISDDIKANDLIQKQKITTLTEQLRQKQIVIKQISEQISVLEDKNKILSQNLSNKEFQCKKLQITLQEEQNLRSKVQKNNQQLQNEIKGLNSQISTLRNALKQKDLNISGLKSTIDYSDKLISIKSSELSEKDFQKTKIQLQCSYKSQVLQKMEKVNQQHTKSISQLQIDRSKLNQLVGCLKQQLYITDNQKNMLKIALGQAQHTAIQKSISLQNLKHDVRVLKYTLPEALKTSRMFLEV